MIITKTAKNFLLKLEIDQAAHARTLLEQFITDLGSVTGGDLDSVLSDIVTIGCNKYSTEHFDQASANWRKLDWRKSAVQQAKGADMATLKVLFKCLLSAIPRMDKSGKAEAEHINAALVKEITKRAYNK